MTKVRVRLEAGQPLSGGPTIWLIFPNPNPPKLPYVPARDAIVVDDLVSPDERARRLAQYPDLIKDVVGALVGAYLHSISGNSNGMQLRFFAGAKVGGLEEHNQANLVAVRQALDETERFVIV